MKTRTLTWLHLSDIHRCSTRDSSGGELVLSRLLEDLRLLRDSQGLRPDLIFLTGDLAFGQIPEKPLADQLREGWRWLEEVREIYEPTVNVRDVFLVAGNHDVDRSRINRKDQFWLKNLAKNHDKNEIYQLLLRGGEDWRDYMKRLADFEAFVAECCPHLADDSGRCVFSAIRNKSGLKVGVAGFNSAWSSGTKDDKGNLWLGDWQLDEMALRIKDVDVRIAMVHHPLNWLVEAEDPSLKIRFQSEFHVLLHGHEHRPWLEVPHKNHMNVAAGAVLERPGAELGYNFSRFDLDNGQGEVWMRTFDRRVGQWKGDVFADRTDWRGVWFVAVPWPEPAGRESEVGKDVEVFGSDNQSDLLSRAEDICLIKEGEGARIYRQEHESGMGYLRVLRREGNIVRDFAVAATIEATDDLLGKFLLIQRRYRHFDPGVVSYLVCEKAPREGLVRRAEKERVRLLSFVEYQGLIDFRSYVKRQNIRLEDDPNYNPILYVPQSIHYRFGDAAKTGEAVETVMNWLDDTHGRFILILGEFGTGKTFLLHEIARRIGNVGGLLTPVLVELRDLEKGRSLDELVAQHFARTGIERLNFKAFRYMLREGRIVLLFDGFDELALRVTYERAAEHFDTLVAAADGEAKIVVTSRTQYFESDDQIRTTLGDRVGQLRGHRIAHLQKFDRNQIQEFLAHRFGDSEASSRRFKLITEIRDLMGLSQVPRMLGFIADLPEEDLLTAERKTGKIHAAELYRLLLNRWIGHEVERQAPKGGTPVLSEEQRWDAVDKLALRLWGNTERFVNVREMTEEAAALEELARNKISRDVAAHQVGSGTLLVRNAQGEFSFIHQSVLEWLVARRAAREIRKFGASRALSVEKISPLMAEFLRDLLGPEDSKVWVEAALTVDDGALKGNALIFLERLEAVGIRVGSALNLSGEDLKGRDFSRENLDSVDFSHTDLTGAKLVGSSLLRAQLQGVKLNNADLSQADLREADLSDADLTSTSLMGADLRGVDLSGSMLCRTKLVGARLGGNLKKIKGFGVALPDAKDPQPYFSLPSPCRSVAWSASYDILATGHDDGCVRLWDTTSGREICRMCSHHEKVWSVSFSPDGSLLATASSDRKVVVWDVESAEVIVEIGGHQAEVNSVAFSPDGSCVASACRDRVVRLWDVKLAKEMARFTGHMAEVNAVCFSPNGRCLASGSADTTVLLWDVDTSRQLWKLAGHREEVWDLSFSPGGSFIASASDDKTVILWDIQAGEQRGRFTGHLSHVLSVCFNPDGSLLASGSSDNTIRLWDVKSGRLKARLNGHSSAVWGLSFSADGLRLASGSQDSTVRLWNVSSYRSVAKLDDFGLNVSCLAFNSDGSSLVSCSSDSSLHFWDLGVVRQASRIMGENSSTRSVCFSPDDSWVATGLDDGMISLRNSSEDGELQKLSGHKSSVNCVCFSPNGSWLASGSVDKSVRIWDASSGRNPVVCAGHSGAVRSVCFSPDSSLLASGSDDYTLILWNFVSAQRLVTFTGHKSYVVSVAFGPDGSLVASGSHDRSVIIWNIKRSNSFAELVGHQSFVSGVCFSPDGSLVASSSADKTVRLWKVETAKQVAVFAGHQACVLDVKFSPDGSRLASSSADNTIRLWDVKSRECLAILVPLAEGWVAYTLDGRYKVGGEVAGTFWYSLGLCRFELGELDAYLPLRVPCDDPLIKERGPKSADDVFSMDEREIDKQKGRHPLW